MVAHDATEVARRPRCVRCGRPLALPRSVARAYGPKCWARTALDQLERRRDAVGRQLGALAALVATMDDGALAVVSMALDALEVTQ